MVGLDQVLAEIIEDALLDVHTAFPAKVMRYDSTKQLADLQPLVQVNGRVLPPLLQVPVCWPRAGDAYMTLPLKQGHHVLVLCSEESTEVVRGGGETGASALRRHGFGGAYCIPGCAPDSQVLDSHPDNIVVGFKDGGQIHVKPDGSISLGSESPSQGVAKGSSTNSEITSTLADINVLKAATNTLAGILDGIAPGTSTAFGVATGAIPHSPSSVESSVVKTE